jgi:hypothetical protein
MQYQIPRGTTAVQGIPIGRLANLESRVSYLETHGGSGFTLLPATGAVDGSNTTFTFTEQPTYIISDGAWYRVNKGFTFSVLTATMSVPPSTDIWGFI